MIKPKFIVFSDTWPSYVATYWKKTVLKKLLKKYHSHKFLNYALIGFLKFLNEIPSNILKVNISIMGVNVFLFILKKQMFMWREYINQRILS